MKGSEQFWRWVTFFFFLPGHLKYSLLIVKSAENTLKPLHLAAHALLRLLDEHTLASRNRGCGHILGQLVRSVIHLSHRDVSTYVNRAYRVIKVCSWRSINDVNFLYLYALSRIIVDRNRLFLTRFLTFFFVNLALTLPLSSPLKFASLLLHDFLVLGSNSAKATLCANVFGSPIKEHTLTR